MIDYYLRSPSAEIMHAALEQLPDDVTVDDIGTLYRLLEDGENFEALPGYHANVRSPEPITWPDGVESLNLETPWRIFA